MMLLAVQYAIQPRLSKKLIAPEVNKQSVALVEEVVKTSMAAFIFLNKPKDVINAAVAGQFHNEYCFALSSRLITQFTFFSHAYTHTHI